MTEKPQDRACILVVGMHRSGTSALAGLLHQLGINLPPVEMIGATPSNRLGHFEPCPLVELHDRLLAELDSGWPDSRAIPKTSYEAEAIQPFRREIAGMVADWVGQAGPVIVKDPRMCRLLPLWRQVLEDIGIEPRVILAWRNPLSVAGSLAARDGYLPAAGLLIWLRHVLDAEAGTRGWRRSVLRYESMLADWRGEIGRVGLQLGLDLADFDTAGEFIDPGEAHHQRGDADIAASQDVPSRLRNLLIATMAAHERLSADAADGEALAMLDAVRLEFDDITREIGDLIFGYTNLRPQLMEAEARATFLAAALESSDEAARRMQRSMSWRITAPLRQIWDWLGKR